MLSALGVPPVNEADIDCRMFVGYALEEGRKQHMAHPENSFEIGIAYSKDVCHHCGGHLEELTEFVSIDIAKRSPRYGRSQDKVLKACEKCGLVYLKEI